MRVIIIRLYQYGATPLHLLRQSMTSFQRGEEQYHCDFVDVLIHNGACVFALRKVLAG